MAVDQNLIRELINDGLSQRSAVSIATAIATAKAADAADVALPPIAGAGDASKVVAVKADHTGYELTTPDSGGSSWVEHVLSTDLADWTDDGAGTWTTDGTTIQQTDPTASQAHLTTVAKFSGPVAIVEAVVKLPTGQDVGTFPEVHMGFFASTGATLDEWTSGWALAPEVAGDTGPFDVTAVGDGGPAPLTGADTVAINTTHTLRAVVDLTTQAVFLDGVLSVQNVVAQPVATAVSPGACHVSLYATGLVEFSALKIWTLALPA